MDKSECKKGYRVVRTSNFKGHSKGVFTIEGFQRDNLVNFEEINGAYSLDNFELFSRFKVGDKVLYKGCCDNYEEVEYRGENSRGEPIVEFESGFVTRARRDYLLKTKKKEDLEIGDKIMAYGNEYTVLEVGNDDLGKAYLCKTYGYCQVVCETIRPECITNIIYD